MNICRAQDPSDGLALPTQLEAERAVQQARDLFAKTLARWAIDALVIRRTGTGRTIWSGLQNYTSLSSAA